MPQFEGRDGSMSPNPQAGIHSHADYLIHDHPYASDEAGKKATLGRYLGYAQSSVSSDSIKLWSNWVPNVDLTRTATSARTPGSPASCSGRSASSASRGRPKAETGNPADHHIAERRDHRPLLRAEGHQARAAAGLRRGPESRSATSAVSPRCRRATASSTTVATPDGEHAHGRVDATTSPPARRQYHQPSTP